MARSTDQLPIVVIFGEEPHRKLRALTETLDRLLPPDVDRGMALSTYDATQREDAGGPTIARVLEDLTTMPFLAPLRVVVIREADGFLSGRTDAGRTHREILEKYLERPAPTGVLVLECRSFPKTTRLYKQVDAIGGEIVECKKLSGRALVEFLLDMAGRRGKKLQPAAAERLVDLVGQDAGALEAELEKLALYVGDDGAITTDAVADLVGQTREEKIFAVMDAAGQGQLAAALRMWEQTLETDPEAVYKVVGGIAFVLRKWLKAARLHAEGTPARALAPQVMMWGRERELEAILAKQSPRRLRRAIAALADLDAQAKSGARSIESGVELLLARLAS